MKRNDLCWCSSGKKWKKCHYPKTSPPFSFLPSDQLTREYKKKYQILLKSEEEIAGIRRASQLAAEILEKSCAAAKEGVTTSELNDLAHRLHIEAGATPAPLHYGSPPFPSSICTSLNEVICHGIPNDAPLKKGDILNIDVTSILNGYYGDCSRMVCIEPVPKEKAHLVSVTKECLDRAIAQLKPGVPIGEIGKIIEKHATENNYSVVYQFGGHGVGLQFHEAPHIHHFENQNRIPLVPGMIFTIEPMINLGVPEAVIDKNDHWTARTKDRKPSAQWEHTLLITPEGCEILTAIPS